MESFNSYLAWRLSTPPKTRLSTACTRSTRAALRASPASTLGSSACTPYIAGVACMPDREEAPFRFGLDDSYSTVEPCVECEAFSETLEVLASPTNKTVALSVYPNLGGRPDACAVPIVTAGRLWASTSKGFCVSESRWPPRCMRCSDRNCRQVVGKHLKGSGMFVCKVDGGLSPSIPKDFEVRAEYSHYPPSW